MNGTAKFRMNLRTGEIEIEGSEDFVDRQIQALEALVELMEQASPVTDSNGDDTDGIVDSEQDPGQTATDTLPKTFGEWMHSFKADVNDLDKALITARFVQSQSEENDFKTSDVNKALQEHGIKLSNPSVSLKRLAEKKLMFQTRKVGKLRFMRVSVDGQNHLTTLRQKG